MQKPFATCLKGARVKSKGEKGIGKFLLIVPWCHKTVIRVAEKPGENEGKGFSCLLYGEYDYWQGLSVWLGACVVSFMANFMHLCDKMVKHQGRVFSL